jgi:uncharacterized protein YndB with AHSA1/START domain
MNPDERAAEVEIVSTRVLGAPRDVVFEAFSDPDRLVQWWGPAGFTNTFSEFDLRPGGAWRFVMHGPDGTVYELAKDFVEVVRPERIVLQHLQPMHRFRMTMIFTEQPGGTKLTWRMLFEATEDARALERSIVEANEQNFDRLERYLETSSREDPAR